MVEAIINSQVEELYQGLLENKEIFIEIKNHFSENKKLMEPLTAILAAFGMKIEPKNSHAHTNPVTSMDGVSIKNAENLLYQNNQKSNINLFEEFETKLDSNSNANGNNIISGENNHGNNNSNSNLFSMLSVNSQNANQAVNKNINYNNEYGRNNNNINLLLDINNSNGSCSNNNFYNNQKANNLLSNNNNLINTNSSQNNQPHSLLNNAPQEEGTVEGVNSTKTNKGFAFIKNKQNQNQQSYISANNTPQNNLFGNLNVVSQAALNTNTQTGDAKQKSQFQANPTNNNIVDLFGSLNINSDSQSNQSSINSQTISNNEAGLVNNISKFSNKTPSVDSTINNSKTGFSFIKKDKQNSSSNY